MYKCTTEYIPALFEILLSNIFIHIDARKLQSIHCYSVCSTQMDKNILASMNTIYNQLTISTQKHLLYDSTMGLCTSDQKQYVPKRHEHTQIDNNHHRNTEVGNWHSSSWPKFNPFPNCPQSRIFLTLAVIFKITVAMFYNLKSRSEKKFYFRLNALFSRHWDYLTTKHWCTSHYSFLRSCLSCIRCNFPFVHFHITLHIRLLWHHNVKQSSTAHSLFVSFMVLFLMRLQQN